MTKEERRNKIDEILGLTPNVDIDNYEIKPLQVNIECVNDASDIFNKIFPKPGVHLSELIKVFELMDISYKVNQMFDKDGLFAGNNGYDTYVSVGSSLGKECIFYFLFGLFVNIDILN